MKVLVTELCLTLCNPMDCSPPGSSIHGISQARILEWVAISFSRGSSRSRDWTRVSCIAGRFFFIWATRWQFTAHLILLLKSFCGDRDKDLPNPHHFLSSSAVTSCCFSEIFVSISDFSLVIPFPFLFCDAPRGLPALYTGILAGRSWAAPAWDRSRGRSWHSWRQRASGGARGAHSLAPRRLPPKGPAPRGGCWVSSRQRKFIFTLQEPEGLPLSFKVLSQRCPWGSRPLKEPEQLIYFVGWALKPSAGGREWRCADREGR